MVQLFKVQKSPDSWTNKSYLFEYCHCVHTLLDLNCFRPSSYVAQKWFFEWVGGRLWPLFIHNSCHIATNIDLCIVIELLYMFFGGAFIQLKSSQNKKGRKNFQLHRFLNTFSQLPAVKKYSKNGAAGKFLGPSYFDPALVGM